MSSLQACAALRLRFAHLVHDTRRVQTDARRTRDAVAQRRQACPVRRRLRLAAGGCDTATPALRPLILVVDDGADARAVYTHLLLLHGFDVIAASDGDAAAAMTRKHQPDLVLMDLAMPRVDGWTAIARIKADPATADVPVIAITGHVDPASEGRTWKGGVDAFLKKPCEPAQVLATIRAMIARRRHG